MKPAQSPAQPEPAPAQQMIVTLCLLGMLIFLRCEGVYSGLGLLLMITMVVIGRQYSKSEAILTRMAKTTTSVSQS